MSENIFGNIFGETIEAGSFLIALISAAVLGLIAALCYMYKTDYTKSFIVTLALLPPVVAAVIMMVSGSLGASVAVAGTFSLVRFRSAQGTAKEIAAVFISMAAGLACGMGFPVYAAIFTVLIGLINILYAKVGFGERKNAELKKTLTVVVPEDLNYGSIFDDIMEKYTSEHKLIKVRTTNLGSLNKLTYNITLKEKNTEKNIIDDIRCRNGNLEICVSLQETDSDL